MRHGFQQQTGRWMGSAALAAAAAVWAVRSPAMAADDLAVVAAADVKTPATQPDANIDSARPGRPPTGRGEGGRAEGGRADGGPGERRRGMGFGGGGLGGAGFGMGGGFGGGAFAGATPSQEDRDNAMAFLNEHAPVYAKWITTSAALPDNDRLRVENVIARAHASYEALKPTDPELYGVILKRIASEDRIFDLRSQIQGAGDEDARAKLVADLRAQVTDWCDLSSKERHLRLARLERTVQKEKDSLAAEDAAREKTIEARVNRIVNGGGGGGRGMLPGAFGDGGGGRRRTADPGDTIGDPQQGPR